jgi:hypothetical protein
MSIVTGMSSNHVPTDEALAIAMNELRAQQIEKERLRVAHLRLISDLKTQTSLLRAANEASRKSLEAGARAVLASRALTRVLK